MSKKGPTDGRQPHAAPFDASAIAPLAAAGGRTSGARVSEGLSLQQALAQLRRAEAREQAAVRRLAQLQEVTARFAAARSPDEVAEVLVSVSEGVLGADASVAYLVDPSNGALTLAAAHGAPGVASRWPTLPLEAELPLATAVRTNEPLWLESRAALEAAYPGLTGHPHPLETVVALPLSQGTCAIGGLALSFAETRTFDAEDRVWLHGLAAQAALASERARLFQAERRARDEAETLLRIAGSLNAVELDLEVLLQRLTDEATALVGAKFGAFFYNAVNQRGEEYLLYALSGAPKEAFARFGDPRKTAIFAPTFDGVGVVRIDDVTKDPRYGHTAPHHGMPKGHLPVASYLAVPVVSGRGVVLGGLFFGHPEAGRFTAAHEHLVTALGATAAATIDNARLYRRSKETVDEQRRLSENLAEIIRVNELLAGVLAHDLRNPLSAIITGAHLLIMKDRKRAEGDRLGPAVERILSSGQRMGRMVDQLLDVSRIRLGAGMQLDRRELDLADLVGQVVAEFGASAPRFVATGDARGIWDPDRLSQVFSNLIGNALQHGTPDQPVAVAVDGSCDEVRVSVQNGGLIPPDLVPKLFDPLTAGERPRDRARGLGLGLFISREIVKAHGGTVDVSSNESDGTRFAVTLPRGRAD